MKRFLLIPSMFLAGAGLAAAQMVSPTTDVLGAHLNYGRGCTACHAPHSASVTRVGFRRGEAGGGNTILWGEDVTGLYGRVIATGGGSYTEVLPTSMSATTPDVNGILSCLSCHDGNYAQNAMMKNKLYETLPASYGAGNSVPTLLGSSGSGGSFNGEHPMGLSARMTCGGPTHWDCSQANGVVSMKGAKSSRFVSNYGFFVKPGNYNGNAVIVCTTCHDQHSMNVVTVTKGSSSGLPPGNYATMFFLRGPYNPKDPNPQSNQTAQFCRQCHGDKSNEMLGSTAGTVF